MQDWAEIDLPFSIYSLSSISLCIDFYFERTLIVCHWPSFCAIFFFSPQFLLSFSQYYVWFFFFFFLRLAFNSEIPLTYPFSVRSIQNDLKMHKINWDESIFCVCLYQKNTVWMVFTFFFFFALWFDFSFDCFQYFFFVWYIRMWMQLISRADAARTSIKQ